MILFGLTAAPQQEQPQDSFLIETATGAERARFGLLQSIAFSPDSRWLATKARLIDLRGEE